MNMTSLIKSFVVILILLVPGVIRAQSSTGQVFVLVRLTDYEGLRTFKSVTPDEYNSLHHAAQKDNDALPVAYANLRKEWRKTNAQEARKSKPASKKGRSGQTAPAVSIPPFPLKCPEPREVAQLGTFTSQEELNKKKELLEAQELQHAEKRTAENDKKASEKESDVPKGGHKHAAAKPAKGSHSALPTSEKELLDKLIQEIERVKAEKDSADSKDNINTMAGSKSDIKTMAGGGNKSKSHPVHRMNE